ncbi:hypothetical protein [Devosia sp. 66-22]|uniref:hypothetical protein n=1 Tax=Devosia sp. 66-22 TaxID=1895753 RepID=UPI00260FD8E7|nr:hypothetical protein [Devosia sp. 66-22]
MAQADVHAAEHLGEREVVPQADDVDLDLIAALSGWRKEKRGGVLKVVSVARVRLRDRHITNDEHVNVLEGDAVYLVAEVASGNDVAGGRPRPAST